VEDESGRPIETGHLVGARPGKWLDGYIPSKDEAEWFVEDGGLRIDIEERDSGTRWKYQRSDVVAKQKPYEETGNVLLQDIIIIGEVSQPNLQP
jgi:hypothetical protein